ncbi:hypothetical protein ACTFIW_001767 [Dictyostelium discoideum]
MTQRDVIDIISSDEEEKKPSSKVSNSGFNFSLEGEEDDEDESIEQTFMTEKEKKKKLSEEKKKSKKTTTTTTTSTSTNNSNNSNNSNKRSSYSSLTINKKPRIDNDDNNNNSGIVNLDDYEDDSGNDNDTRTKKSSSSSSSSSKRKSKNSDEDDGNSKKKRSTNDNHDSFNYNNNTNNNTNSLIDDADDVSDSELDQEFKPSKPSKKSTTTSSKTKSSSSSSKQKSTSSSNKKKTPKPKKITKTTCLEETFIIFDKNLENELGIDDIKAQLELKTPNIEFTNSTIPYSIRFIRRFNNNNNNNNNQNDEENDNNNNNNNNIDNNNNNIDNNINNNNNIDNINSNEQYEKFVILKYSAKMLTQLIQNNELIEKISKVKRDNPTCNFTLLVESLDSYLHQISKSISKQTIQKGLLEKNINALTMNLPPTKVTIEKILVQVQMDFSITIRTIENRNDIVNFLFKSFQTVALLPLRSEDQLFEGFCADSIKKRKQTSLCDTWSNQLCQITGISSNIARGIVAKYPTVTSLFSYYGDSSSEYEKENLLRDVKIDQNRGTKNLGPVLSSKIYHIFSSKDPNRIIY